MAVTHKKPVVVRGVLVVRGEMTGTALIGFDHGRGQAPAFLSQGRRLSPSNPRLGNQSDPRRFLADDLDLEAVAERAGRPGSLAGVLVSRSPAMPAGRAVLCGWPPAAGEPCATAVRHFGFTMAKRLMFGAMELPGRSQAFGAGRYWRSSCAKQSGQCQKARLAGLKPASGTLSASTRGKGN